MVDQLKGLLKIDQDLLKMKCEDWGGGAPGPCFPNPGTLAAMPSMRSSEVIQAAFCTQVTEYVLCSRVRCILETLRRQLCGLEV